ncbi:MAG: hypothetical protein HRU26_09510 [Psychroserpens sp.]|nr:hypothetical protein [Psychroserpens sp.]
MFFLVIFSCHSEKERRTNYSKFAKQITPNGKYVIYEYSRFGSKPFNSEISKTEVFPAVQKFVEGQGTDIKGSIGEWLSEDTLLVYNFKSETKRSKHNSPVKTEYQTIGALTIKTVHYKTNSGVRSFKYFDAVRTTDDSIFVQIVEGQHKRRTLSFPLGGTTIKANSDSIFHISVKSRVSRNMDFVYKNTESSESHRNPDVRNTWYDLTPTRRINPAALHQNKIFWEIIEQ